ncbi:MAG: class I SAM-dependent methyltransferase [Nanoarchaeota archaeon]
MVHHHAGKSSAAFFAADDILHPLGLSSDMVLLDAGCGDGRIAMDAASKVRKVFAFDIHNESIAAAKAIAPSNVDARVVDLKSIPLNDCGVDVCVLVNVLHGLVANDEHAAIAEISRVIKDNGTLAVVEFKTDSHFGPPKDIRLSAKDIVDTFVGFEESQRKMMEHHFMLVLKKGITA